MKSQEKEKKGKNTSKFSTHELGSVAQNENYHQSFNPEPWKGSSADDMTASKPWVLLSRLPPIAGCHPLGLGQAGGKEFIDLTGHLQKVIVYVKGSDSGVLYRRKGMKA